MGHIEPGQFRVGQILEPEVLAGQTLKMLVMTDDQLAVGRPLDIQLDAVQAHVMGSLEGRHGVFGVIFPDPPVGE